MVQRQHIRWIIHRWLERRPRYTSNHNRRSLLRLIQKRHEAWHGYRKIQIWLTILRRVPRWLTLLGQITHKDRGRDHNHCTMMIFFTDLILGYNNWLRMKATNSELSCYLIEYMWRYPGRPLVRAPLARSRRPSIGTLVNQWPLRYLRRIRSRTLRMWNEYQGSCISSN